MPKRRRAGARGRRRAAAEIAREDPDHRREETRDECGGGADQQRVASAVEETGSDVSPLIVGTEQIVARIPRRANRGGAQPQPRGRRRHDQYALSVHDRRPIEVRLKRVGVRDVVRVERRRKARDDDDGEHGGHHHRDLVAAQPPPRERPRARAGGNLLAFGGDDDAVGRYTAHADVLSGGGA